MIENKIISDNVNGLVAQIKAQRQLKGWSQDELARRSGLSKSYLANSEQGRTYLGMNILTLRAISRALNYYDWDIYS